MKDIDYSCKVLALTFNIKIALYAEEKNHLVLIAPPITNRVKHENKCQLRKSGV